MKRIPLTTKQRYAVFWKYRFKCRSCGITDVEHRQTRGRRLEVHHKDRDPSNNEPKNLMLLCLSCHRRYHYKKKPINQQELVSLREEGRSFSEIGNHYGVSQQRAHQVYKAASQVLDKQS